MELRGILLDCNSDVPLLRFDLVDQDWAGTGTDASPRNICKHHWMYMENLCRLQHFLVNKWLQSTRLFMVTSSHCKIDIAYGWMSLSL